MHWRIFQFFDIFSNNKQRIKQRINYILCLELIYFVSICIYKIMLTDIFKNKRLQIILISLIGLFLLTQGLKQYGLYENMETKHNKKEGLVGQASTTVDVYDF